MVLVFIGKEFLFNDFLKESLLKQYNFKNIYFFDNVDFDINSILRNYSKILIVSNRKNYSTISKLVATLNDDTLELKGKFGLYPSKVLKYEKNSFLVAINNSLVNVIKYENYLPKVFFEEKYNILHILHYDVESANLFVKPIFESFNIEYTIYENLGGWCEIVVSELNEILLKQLKGFIPHLIVANNIFEYIKNRLEEKKEKITFAESCTGGLLVSNFTKVPGISHIFDGSVISYANEIKNRWLGVDKRVLEKFGAVSEETIQQMLLGILELSESDYAVAISGIAGPDGGTKTKPVGSVFVGVAHRNGKFQIERLQLNGNREEIQYKSVMNAVRILLDFI